MKLLVLSPEDREVNETLCVEQMFRAGLERYHLRKPSWSEEELRAFLEDIPGEFLHRIVLHDHYALLHQFELMGAHFNQRNAESWPTVPKNVHRSISCHSISELKSLDPNEFQDAFFSPVFPSLSKKGYLPMYELEEMEQAVKSSAVPVIALGGIDTHTLPDVEKLGFAGAAVLGSVWQSGDPFEAFQKLYEACPRAELPY